MHIFILKPASLSAIEPALLFTIGLINIDIPATPDMIMLVISRKRHYQRLIPLLQFDVFLLWLYIPMALLLLLQALPLVTVTAQQIDREDLNVCLSSSSSSSSEESNFDSCDSASINSNVGQLRPWHLPQPVVFTAFESNETVIIFADEKEKETQQLSVARGKVQQINKITSNSNKDKDTTTNYYGTDFSVISGALNRTSVDKLLQILESYPYLDDDPDTVDGMPTYEIFVDSPDLVVGHINPSLKFRDSDPQFAPQRKTLRQQLQTILQPYLDNLITPFVHQQYPQSCSQKKGPDTDEDRVCTPCYSLIRKYRHGERQSHATHHDGHAIVTVVVSLSDYNVDYRGGLYVSTGFGQREFIALHKGDAVVHQPGLLHGVKVLDLETDPEQTQRWSWIVWYKDSSKCQDYSHQWFAECAQQQGDPICQQLHATKVGNIPGISQQETAQQVLEWNTKAAQGGAGMAAVKVARAYLHQLPSSLPFSIEEAQRYYQMAIASHNPDGHYGIAHLLLQLVTFEQTQQQQQQPQHNTNAYSDPRVSVAVQHLEAAAKMDHAFSMFNLGMVHTYGYSTGVINGTLAGQWFEASGLPEGYYLAAQQAKAMGNMERYEDCGKRAHILGFMAPWRKQAREATGSGGAAGVNLNLPWPLAMDGRRPPQL